MFFPLWLFFIYYLMYFPYIELRYHSPILKDEKNICSISVIKFLLPRKFDYKNRTI